MPCYGSLQEPNKIMIRAIQSVTKEYLLSGQCNAPHTSPFIAQRHCTTILAAGITLAVTYKILTKV